MEDFAARVGAEIERNAALAEVVAGEGRREAAQVVARERLDLDHIRAQFRQQRAGVGAGDDRSQIEYAVARERTGHSRRLTLWRWHRDGRFYPVVLLIE